MSTARIASPARGGATSSAGGGSVVQRQLRYEHKQQPPKGIGTERAVVAGAAYYGGAVMSAHRATTHTANGGGGGGGGSGVLAATAAAVTSRYHVDNQQRIPAGASIPATTGTARGSGAGMSPAARPSSSSAVSRHQSPTLVSRRPMTSASSGVAAARRVPNSIPLKHGHVAVAATTTSTSGAASSRDRELADLVRTFRVRIAPTLHGRAEDILRRLRHLFVDTSSNSNAPTAGAEGARCSSSSPSTSPHHCRPDDGSTAQQRYFYLDSSEVTFLHSVRDRNECFMQGVEGILTECVNQSNTRDGGGGGMSSAAGVQQAYETWSYCNGLNAQISFALAQVGPYGGHGGSSSSASRRKSSPPQQRQQHSNAASEERSDAMAHDDHEHAEGSGGKPLQAFHIGNVAPLPLPRTFQDVRMPSAGAHNSAAGTKTMIVAQVMSRASAAKTSGGGGSGATMTRQERHALDMLLRRGAAGASATVTADDVRRAQVLFDKAYSASSTAATAGSSISSKGSGGGGGKIAFMEWLAGLPVETLREVESQL